MTEEPKTATDAPAEVTPPFSATTPKTGKNSGVNNPFVWGTGRRKTAVARVRIRPGTGQFMVNKRKVDEFFPLEHARQEVRTPLTVTDTAKSIDVFVNVRGGGPTGQAGAVVLGLARALIKANTDHEAKLREHKLLSRDPRKVERKKYGQRGARRRFQFSKR